MKARIMFKDDYLVQPDATRRSRRIGANDNFRSLEFDTSGQERDWRAVCLVAAIVCGFFAFIFLPLW